jgi:hypothetical protein
MEVKIKGRVYRFEFDSVWGPLYTYEEVCGERLPFDAKKTICLHILFWCILFRANKDFTLTVDEFVQALNDVQLAIQMRDYYVKRMGVLTEGAMTDDEAEGDEGKKKD